MNSRGFQHKVNWSTAISSTIRHPSDEDIRPTWQLYTGFLLKYTSSLQPQSRMDKIYPTQAQALNVSIVNTSRYCHDGRSSQLCPLGLSLLDISIVINPTYCHDWRTTDWTSPTRTYHEALNSKMEESPTWHQWFKIDSKTSWFQLKDIIRFTKKTHRIRLS